MKNKFRVNKTVLFITLSLLIIIPTESCKESSENVMPSEYVMQTKLLDLDIYRKNRSFNKEEHDILVEARKRMDKHIFISDGKYELKISKGSEIGISDRLFTSLKASMQTANKMIATGNLVVYRNKLVVKKVNKPLTNKIFTEVSEDSDVTLYWWGVEIKLDHNATLGLIAAGALAARYAKYIPRIGTVASEVIALITAAGALRYTTSGCTSGITINYPWACCTSVYLNC